MPYRLARFLLPMLLFLLGSISPSSGGETAFSSHLLPPDPCWQATRGSQAATSPGTAAGVGNPAAAPDGALCRLTFTHLAWAGEVSREWVASAWQLPNRWSLIADAGLLRTPELNSFDEEGNDTGSFQPMEWTVGASLGIPIGKAVRVGVGLRTFHLEDDASSISGIGGSLGIHWSAVSRRLGAAVTDFGPEVSGGEIPASLPSRWRAGFEQDFDDGRWTAAILMEGGRDRSPKVLTGVVIRPVAGLELLAGLAQETAGETDPLGHWSAGGRFRQGSIELGYAFLPGGILEPTHHMGITLSLGESAGHLGQEVSRR